ncbi:MAG TPA: glycosyltransferase family 39 protein [Polyangiaceae bacterium]
MSVLSRIARWLRDPLIALLLGGGYVALLLATAHDLGYARDEGFYFDAARSYEGWFQLLARDPRAALQPSGVDRYWQANHEHPALMKSLFALSHSLLHEKWRWFREAGTAYRFPGMFVSGLAVSVTYLWGQRAIGRLPGIVAALLLAFMPRVFFNSHLACFDMPVAAMWLVTTYAYWRSITTGGVLWPIATGILYGLLLNTKHNSWLLPGALVLHFLVTQAPAWRRGLTAGRIAAPLALFTMATLGPLVFYAGWPWIWWNTGARIIEYVQFHTGHEYYNMEFLGRTYWKPPMPRLYAWVMTAATVPGITLLLFLLGSFGSFVLPARARWQALRRRVRGVGASDASPITTPARPDEWQTSVLWLVCIVLSYAPWFSEKTPIFGGTKHWITAYPFLALFAARGFALTCDRLRIAFGNCAWSRQGVPAVVFALVALGPAVMTLHSHPFGLSAYTPLVGGAPGAATLGLNRTFWGYTTGSVTEFLNRHVPQGGRVYVHDTAGSSWQMLVDDGRLRADLRSAWSIEASDFALYHHEPHMGKVEYQIWVAYGTTRPAHVVAHDGVPVIWVYARPGLMR